MIGNPRRGVKISNHWNQGEFFYKKDATTINPIMAKPVRAIETSIATIDFAFIAACSVLLMGKVKAQAMPIRGVMRNILLIAHKTVFRCSAVAPSVRMNENNLPQIRALRTVKSGRTKEAIARWISTFGLIRFLRPQAFPTFEERMS